MKLRTKISLIFFLVFGIQINAMDSNPVIAAFEQPTEPVDPEPTDESIYGSSVYNEGPLDPAPQSHSALTHSSINPLTVRSPKTTPTSYGSNVEVTTGTQDDPSFDPEMLNRGGWNPSLQRSEPTVSANEAGLTPEEMQQIDAEVKAQIEQEQALRRAARAKSLEEKKAARQAARLEAQEAKRIQHELNLEVAKQRGAVKAQQIIKNIEDQLVEDQLEEQQELPNNSEDLGGLPKVSSAGVASFNSDFSKEIENVKKLLQQSTLSEQDQATVESFLSDYQSLSQEMTPVQRGMYKAIEIEFNMRYPNYKESNVQNEPVVSSALSRSEAARAEREEILQELRKRFEIGEVGSGDKFQEMQKARVTLFEVAVRDGSQKNFIENYLNKDISAAQQLLRSPSLFTPEKVEYTIFKIAQEKYFSNFMTEAQQNALDVIGQKILEKFPIESQFAIDYMYTKYGPPTFDTPDQAEEDEPLSLDVEQGEGDTNSNASGDNDLLDIEENLVQLEEQALVAQDFLTASESLAEDLQKEVVGIKSLVTSSNTVKASVKGYMGLQAIFSQQVLGAQSIATIAFTNGELTSSQITQLNNTVQTLTAQEQKLAKEKQKMKQKIAHLQVLNEKIMQKLDVYLKKLEAENAASSTQALQAKIQQIEAYRDALIDEQSYLAAYESNLDNQVDHNKRVTQLYSELLEIFKKEKQEVTEAEQDGEVDDEDEMEDPSEEKECARDMVQEELLKYQLEGIISELQRLNEVFGADFVNLKSKVITAVSSLISNINKSDSILELIEQGVKKSKTQHIFTSEEQLLAAEPFNLLGVSIASVARTLEALGDKINDLKQDHPEKEDKVICQMLAGRLMALNKKLEEADKLFKVLEEQNAFALYLISLT